MPMRDLGQDDNQHDNQYDDNAEQYKGRLVVRDKRTGTKWSYGGKLPKDAFEDEYEVVKDNRPWWKR